MTQTFQTIVLDALESEAVVLNTAAYAVPLRVVIEKTYSNTGTLYVLHEWDEVVRVTFDFQYRRATLVFDHDPNTVLGGPSSDTRFHLTPSDSTETKRLLAAWRQRIDEYRQERRRRA